ncbi:MAG: hypothetical protein CME64_17775 [Halobacteriovoraceae bacterium]|nr:hypothetical protein [Halobacteriovoraceae bacterium]|tara:strand:+ start:24370 stop:25182 length:813 start_codon:yes stop_codon:yes gene_type:complete
MLKAFSLVLILITFEKAFACKLRPSNKYISFSAPITYLLEGLSLLEDPSLDAISSFHPVENKDIKQLHGGIFLSKKKLKEMNDSIIFFDESRELKRTLKQSNVKKTIEVVTRNQNPFEAYEKSLGLLSPYLQGCKKRVSKLNNRVGKVKSRIKQSSLPKKTYLFFLGKIGKTGKAPRLIMANDGVVKFLKESLSMKTYPSELAYVPPSSRILNKLENKVFIGLYESKEKLELQKLMPGKYNIGFPNALKPGITQVYFLEALMDLEMFQEK